MLRGDKMKGFKQKDNAVLAWTRRVERRRGKAFVYDPSTDEAFPKGMIVSEYAAPRWSKDGSRIFVGIKEQDAEVAAADSIKANVDIWHWKDQTPQLVQIVQLQQLQARDAAGGDPRRQAASSCNSATTTCATLRRRRTRTSRSDATTRPIAAKWRGARAAPTSTRSTSTPAQRTLIDKGLSRTYGTSPDSKWFLYLKNKQVHAFNLDNGTPVTLDASPVPGKTYVNEDDDHAYEKPIWGLGGWHEGQVGAAV